MTDSAFLRRFARKHTISPSDNARASARGAESWGVTLAEEIKRVRIHWEGDTFPEEFRLKSSRKRSLFLYAEHPLSAAREGEFELLTDGEVIAHGRLKLIYHRDGVAGCELLDFIEGPKPTPNASPEGPALDLDDVSPKRPQQASVSPKYASQRPPPATSTFGRPESQAPRPISVAPTAAENNPPSEARETARPKHRSSTPPKARSSAPPKHRSSTPPKARSSSPPKRPSATPPQRQSDTPPKRETRSERPRRRWSSAPPPAGANVPTADAPKAPQVPSFAPLPLPDFDEAPVPSKDNNLAPSAGLHSSTNTAEPSIIVDQTYLAPQGATLKTKAAGQRKGAAIGIDLGTSNTCASISLNGRPMVIPTRHGKSTVPSMLSLKDGRIIVGDAAAKRAVLYPEETVYGSKRLLGKKFTQDLFEEFQPYFAYPLVETDEHTFGAQLKKRVLPFEEAARLLLAEVRDVAAQHLSRDIDEAVITVPAYFGQGQRDAVRQAARAANLPVRRIVNEPTAAAVAYGYQRDTKATLVVFDLGGGTFDISVLEVDGNSFEVIATGGDPFLGGIDVDDLIANHFLEEFQRIERLTLEPSPLQLARLREAAEEAKCGLSMQTRYSVFLPQFHKHKGKFRPLQLSISREQLDELSADFCDRLVSITAAVLGAQDIDPHQVDDVLLVGGMTRMPQVQAQVESFFGKRPSKRINPDEAVALGAALLAAEESGALRLVDVLPVSIGYAGPGRRFMRLVSRNTTVPAERSFVIPTTDLDQSALPIPLFQGELPDAAHNDYLGTVVIDGIPPGPAGSEIALTIALDDQCKLNVTAVHQRSGALLDVHVDEKRSADAVIEELGAYSGPVSQAPKRQSALGRFFGKLRGMFGR